MSVEYKITVNFNSKENAIILPERTVFSTGKNNTDKIQISKNKIEISAPRKEDKPKYLFERIETIYKLPIYNHLMRSLVFYYTTENKNKIKDIKITVYCNGKKEKEITKTQKQIRTLFSLQGIEHQVIDVEAYFYKFDVFNKRNNSDFYTDILMYWLQGNSEEDSKKAFEYYWRSFNCLYEHLSNGSEKEKLNNIKSYCENNISKFSQTINFIRDNKSDIEENLDWNRYINYKIDYDKKQYKDFCDSSGKILFHNQEFLNLFKNKFENNSAECKNKEELLKKINNSIEQKREDFFIDYVTFLTTRYMYYLRCSNFHAATNYERYVLFDISKFDKEFEIVNRVLCLFLVDLINSVDHFEAS